MVFCYVLKCLSFEYPFKDLSKVYNANDCFFLLIVYHKKDAIVCQATLKNVTFMLTIVYTLNRLSINMLIALMNFLFSGNADCQ